VLWERIKQVPEKQLREAKQNCSQPLCKLLVYRATFAEVDRNVAALVMIVAMLVVFAIPAMVAFAIVIPFMAVLKAAAIAVPVAVVEESALEAWTDPAGAGIRSTSPVALVPTIMPPDGIPVAFNPEKIRARSRRWLNDDSWRRRGTDSDAHTDLGVCAVGAEQKNRGKERKSEQAFHGG
jgi:hypothetical protein